MTGGCATERTGRDACATVEAVLFDLDDTLIDREGAFRRTAEQLYISTPALRADHSLGEVCARLEAWDNDGRADRTWLFQQAQHAWPEIEQSIPRLLEWWFETMPTQVLPDERSLALARDLNAAGIPWGIVTNGGASQRPKIRAAGLETLAPFALCADEFGVRKPFRGVYEEALRLLGNRAAYTTLFVGDTPETDIKGAQELGMVTAWVRRGWAYPAGMRPPDYEVQHVAELRPLLLG